ncbi:integrase core domain-containing protein [Candidatus Cardinium hertigii]|uniref:integrase core domain-containing protein n=1 Tax=Candidatus Cardinium hertigii TaxID=247481 RepID=UPI003D7EEABE
MNGKGRSIDHVVMERFVKTLKYSCFLVNDFKNVKELKEEINSYMTRYNNQRFHSGFNC